MGSSLAAGLGRHRRSNRRDHSTHEPPTLPRNPAGAGFREANSSEIVPPLNLTLAPGLSLSLGIWKCGAQVPITGRQDTGGTGKRTDFIFYLCNPRTGREIAASRPRFSAGRKSQCNCCWDSLWRSPGGTPRRDKTPSAGLLP